MILFFIKINICYKKCGSDANILKNLEKYIEKSLSLDHDNIDYICEIGSYRFRQGKISDAFKYYSRALKLDPKDLNALLGKLKCDVLMNNVKDKSPFESIEKDFPFVYSVPVSYN